MKLYPRNNYKIRKHSLKYKQRQQNNLNVLTGLYICLSQKPYPNDGQGRMIVQLGQVNIFSRLSWFVHMYLKLGTMLADRYFTKQNENHPNNVLPSFLYIGPSCCSCDGSHAPLFSNVAVWRALFCFLLFLDMLLLTFSWHQLIANISTSEPFYYQIFAIFGARVIKLLIHAGIISALLIAITNLKYRYTLKHTPHKNLYALGLGTMIAGLLSYLEFLKPSLKPHWANYDALNSLAPTTTVMINALFVLFIMGTALSMLYALIDYITNTGNRNFIIGALCMILFSLCATAQNPIFDISYWLFSGILIGLIITAAYYLLLRFDRALIPLVILPLIIADNIQQAVLNAFTESIPMHLLAATYCILAAYFWSYSFTLSSETSPIE